MRIGMGSKNKTKIKALKDVLRDYPLLKEGEVMGMEVKIEQFGHPKNLKETVEGAIARAKQAYVGNDYGFGIEGGLLEVPYSKSGYMEVAVCAIYDGKKIHLGLSPGLEWPKKVTKAILTKGLDGSQAMKMAGYTNEEKIGEDKGLVGHLTKGKMTRTEYNRCAIMMVLTHLEFPHYF